MGTIMTIEQLITKMIHDKVIDERLPWRWSWGDHDKCRAFWKTRARVTPAPIWI